MIKVFNLTESDILTRPLHGGSFLALDLPVQDFEFVLDIPAAIKLANDIMRWIPGRLGGYRMEQEESQE